MSSTKNKIRLFIFISFIIFFVFFLAQTSTAQTAPTTPPAPAASTATQALKLKLQIPFSSLGEELQISGDTIGLYIKAVFEFGLAVVVILAVIMIIVGGVKWIISGGDSGKITQAKDQILKALTGLIIGLFAVFMLQTVSPGTVSFKSLDITSIAGIGCCQIGAEYVQLSEADCRKQAGAVVSFQKCTEGTDTYDTAQNCGGTDPLASCFKEDCTTLTGYTKSTDAGACPTDTPNCCKKTGPLTSCTKSNDPVCEDYEYCATGGKCFPKRPLGMDCIDEIENKNDNVCTSGYCFGIAIKQWILGGYVLSDPACTSIYKCTPGYSEGKTGDICFTSYNCGSDLFCACAGWSDQVKKAGPDCSEGTCQKQAGFGKICEQWESCSITDTGVCDLGLCPSIPTDDICVSLTK